MTKTGVPLMGVVEKSTITGTHNKKFAIARTRSPGHRGDRSQPTAYRLRSCHPERSEAESKDPAGLPLGFATGWKAWPRRLRRLRYSLDFARNDRYYGPLR